jgi:nucleoside-diphosphate-sugar epimerase
MRVFLAGATGAIGRPLVSQLIERGHQVTGTTRSPAKVDQLRHLGAEPVVLDGLDGDAVGRAVARAEPDAIVHQLTALAGKADLRRFDRWFSMTNELRTKGTQHLLAAADAAGVDRFIAQSYTGWTNLREGDAPKTEDDPFDPRPAEAQTESLAAIRFVETAVPGSVPEGLVLRFGNLYGPGASETLVELVRKRRMPVIDDGTGVWSWIHVDDAAGATVAALERGTRGLYNIVDDEPARVSEWLPYLAEVVGAKPPRRVPKWVAHLVAGEVVVRWMTEGRGASNAKAERELDWQPVWRSWREGFKRALTNPPPSDRNGRPGPR